MDVVVASHLTLQFPCGTSDRLQPLLLRFDSRFQCRAMDIDRPLEEFVQQSKSSPCILCIEALNRETAVSVLQAAPTDEAGTDGEILSALRHIKYK